MGGGAGAGRGRQGPAGRGRAGGRGRRRSDAGLCRAGDDEASARGRRVRGNADGGEAASGTGRCALLDRGERGQSLHLAGSGRAAGARRRRVALLWEDTGRVAGEGAGGDAGAAGADYGAGGVNMKHSTNIAFDGIL